MVLAVMSLYEIVSFPVGQSTINTFQIVPDQLKIVNHHYTTVNNLHVPVTDIFGS